MANKRAPRNMGQKMRTLKPGRRSPQSTKPGASQPHGRVPSRVLKSRRDIATPNENSRRVIASPTNPSPPRAPRGPIRDLTGDRCESGRPLISCDLDIPPIDVARYHWESGKQGRQRPAGEQINLMIARENGYAYNPKDTRNPITRRHTYQARELVRHHPYRSGPRTERPERGAWTMGDLEGEEGDLVAYTKKLKSKFPLLARAVNSWAANSFLDDTLRAERPRGLTSRSKYYKGSVSYPTDALTTARAPLGKRTCRDNTDDRDHNSASRRKCAGSAQRRVQTPRSPAPKGRPTSKMNRTGNALETGRGALRRDLKREGKSRSLLHAGVQPLARREGISGKATEARRKPILPLHFDSGSYIADSADGDTEHDTDDIGDDGEGGLRDSDEARDGEVAYESVADENGGKDDVLEEDDEMEMEDVCGSVATEDEIDGEGYKVGENSDGDGDGGIEDADEEEDEDDDEDEVSPISRKRERARRHTANYNRSIYSRSGRVCNANRQRNLH